MNANDYWILLSISKQFSLKIALNFPLITLTQVSGGDGPTTHTGSGGNSGNDQWHDCNGDGVLNAGGEITFNP